MEHYYILFDNHTDAMALYGAVKKEGIYAQISPTPRELSVCCGVSLLIREEDIEAIQALAETRALRYLSINGLNNSFDRRRHRYG